MGAYKGSSKIHGGMSCAPYGFLVLGPAAAGAPVAGRLPCCDIARPEPPVGLCFSSLPLPLHSAGTRRGWSVGARGGARLLARWRQTAKRSFPARFARRRKARKSSNPPKGAVSTKLLAVLARAHAREYARTRTRSVQLRRSIVTPVPRVAYPVHCRNNITSGWESS